MSDMPANLSDAQHSSYEAHPILAWVCVLTAGLFFFYEFIQLNMFDAISFNLMQAFSLNASELGRMSSFYFIANVLFLLPAGWLLDRYSTRWIILVSMGICIIGTGLFSYAHFLSVAYACRFFMGVGSAFCFLSCIRLASRWFEPRHMALVTGFLVTMAMIGGMVAQTPLVALVHAFSWRVALRFDAAFGIFLWLVIFFVVRDYPASLKDEFLRETKQVSEHSYFTLAHMAFLRLNNWLAGIYGSLMNLPICLFGGLWGAMYLHDVHHLSQVDATFVVSMLFLGTIVGSPIMGYISDKIGLRRLPMLVAALISLALVVLLFLLHTQNGAIWATLFFFLGFFTAGQIISYPVVAENSYAMITAMSVSVVNITMMGSQAFLQPLFGFLMDRHARAFHPHVLHHYVASDFTWALYLLPIGFIIAFMAAYGVRETYCKHLEEQ